MQSLLMPEWNLLSRDQQMEVARQVLRSLPDGFHFTGIVSHQLRDVRAEIAEFTWQGVRFCLIPGNTVDLGYDAANPFELKTEHGNPHDTELAELRATMEARCTAFRRCSLAPMLVEAVPRRLGYREVSPDDPLVASILSKREGGTEFEVFHREFILCRDARGVVTMADRGKATFERVTADLASEGFRLPENDEWEYLCAAGTRTLFRWGDDCPTDRYPNDTIADAEIVRISREWEPGKPLWNRDVWEWDAHRLPNAFGLEIARDPYQMEAVSTPGLYRGGDGGQVSCGGACYFEGWLALATSWQVKDPFPPDHPRDLTGYLGRRVITIP